MSLNLSGTSGIAGAGIGTIDASGANVTGVVTCTSVVSSGAISGTTGTFTGNLDITADNSKLRIGAAGDDFELFHDGTSNYIRSDTGNLYIESKSGQTAVQIVPDGATDLRHSGNKKFETYSGGVEVTGGTLNMDSAAMQFSGNLSLPNVGACIFRPVADTVAFGINNGQRVSVNQYGLLFGTDTAAANALDDYEEGTYVPTLNFAGSFAGGTIAYQTGTYTKIGRVVHANINLQLTNKGSSTGQLRFTLPFNCADTLASTSVEAGGPITYYNHFSSNASTLYATPVDASSYVVVRGNYQGGNSFTVSNSDVSTNFEFRCTITYFAAS